MISDVMLQMVRANLAASVAIILVGLLRRPARAILGAPGAYRLWALPLLMAIIAIAPVPRSAPAAPAVLSAPGALIADVWAGRSDLWTACGRIWAFGALACAAVLVWRQVRFAAALRGGGTSKLQGATIIKAARADIGPAVFGGAIILPADFDARFTPAEQKAVIAHERRHIARRDIVANAVVAACQCLCWCNPLIHLAARWVRYDQELACDAAVLAEHPGLRRCYGEALIKTQIVGQVPPIACAWRAPGFAALRERILLLGRPPASTRRRAFGALAVILLNLAGGYTAWAAQLPKGSELSNPVWSSRPSGHDLAGLYPRKAQDRDLSGAAVIRCRVEKVGALSACAIVSEAPRGQGFGDAALRMAPLFRMKALSADGKSVAGKIVNIPVRFQIKPKAGAR